MRSEGWLCFEIAFLQVLERQEDFIYNIFRFNCGTRLVPSTTLNFNHKAIYNSPGRLELLVLSTLLTTALTRASWILTVSRIRSAT